MSYNIGDKLISGGYFTWLRFVLDLPSEELCSKLGYKPGALASGWTLMIPANPIQAADFALRGTTRYNDGVMNDGRRIEAVLESRQDTSKSKEKVSAFFLSDPLHTPAKVRSVDQASYQDAVGVGIPQFVLTRKIEWKIAASVRPKEVLRLNQLWL